MCTALHGDTIYKLIEFDSFRFACLPIGQTDRIDINIACWYVHNECRCLCVNELCSPLPQCVRLFVRFACADIKFHEAILNHAITFPHTHNQWITRLHNFFVLLTHTKRLHNRVLADAFNSMANKSCEYITCISQLLAVFLRFSLFQ